MATIGNPTTGGDSQRKIFQGFKGISITMPEAGTVTSITVQCSNTATSGSWQAGVWNTSGVVLGSSTVRTDISANAAYEFTGLSVAVSAATEYIFGVAADGVADDLGDSVIFSSAATYDGRSAGGDADNVDPLSDTTWSADSARDYHVLVTYTPSSSSDTPVTVDKADIQPSGSSVAFASVLAVTAAAFSPSPSVVALQWQQDTLTISVDAAAITLAPQPIDGRRGIPVLTGAPTIAGQTILFQLSSGDWTLPVDSGAPQILGQSVVLEDNRFFLRAAPTLSPSTIVLSENAVVVSAAPSFTGSDITLTWSQGIAGVIQAEFSVQGQSVVLSKTWSLAVDSASFDIDGQNVVFDWVVDSTVVVEPALFSVSGSGFTLDRHIDLLTTEISVVGQTVGRGDGTLVGPALFSVTPQSVEFEYDYILGYAFDPAEFQILGKDVVLYLGTGAPTRVRSVFTKDRIQIAFSIPQTYKTTASERIRG